MFYNLHIAYFCYLQIQLFQSKIILSIYERLSQVAGSKLTDGNPAIADLGDPNRPTQLGEKFSELYDNEWTDAMEELGNAGDEKSNITTLRNIVEVNISRMFSRLCIDIFLCLKPSI